MSAEHIGYDLDSEMEIRPDDGNNWLISYSDLVTVLLCFFIMFFVIKARQQEKNFLESNKNEKKAELILSDVNEQLKISPLSAKANLSKFEKHLALTISSNLFNSDSDELSLDGEYFFTELASVIYKYMPGINIQLSVGQRPEEDLNEKSLKKISQIRRHLTQLGLNQELISIGSHHVKDNDQIDNNQEHIRIFITNNYRMTAQ